jgi:hypothetical protein
MLMPACHLQDILSRFHDAWELRPVRDAAGNVVACDAQLTQDVLPRGECGGDCGSDCFWQQGLNALGFRGALTVRELTQDVLPRGEWGKWWLVGSSRLHSALYRAWGIGGSLAVSQLTQDVLPMGECCRLWLVRSCRVE